MNKNKVKQKIEKVNTTIGDLVVAMTKIAGEHTNNEQEKFMLAAQVVEELLNDKETNVSLSPAN